MKGKGQNVTTGDLRLRLWDDNPSLVDFLCFDAVVAPIVAAIGTPDIDPLAIGVHSPWGGGKSTVLNLLEERLRDQPQYLVVRADPWQYDNHDDVRGDLIVEVLDQVAARFDAKPGDRNGEHLVGNELAAPARGQGGPAPSSRRVRPCAHRRRGRSASRRAHPARGGVRQARPAGDSRAGRAPLGASMHRGEDARRRRRGRSCCRQRRSARLCGLHVRQHRPGRSHRIGRPSGAWYYLPIARARGKDAWDDHAELIDAIARRERQAGWRPDAPAHRAHQGDLPRTTSGAAEG